eukprot:TRINITY_DN48667_c0_g1_i1.p1 TRINITY_DN48667_c0_g1~~TRINITY_DN48667_c0_g1_i1.p1  ORF type:complete len:183 (-),score=21.41 TRINITY_DN48667_c0_g1_i1:233-721(-)
MAQPAAGSGGLPAVAPSGAPSPAPKAPFNPLQVSFSPTSAPWATPLQGTNQAAAFLSSTSYPVAWGDGGAEITDGSSPMDASGDWFPVLIFAFVTVFICWAVGALFSWFRCVAGHPGSPGFRSESAQEGRRAGADSGASYHGFHVSHSINPFGSWRSHTGVL